MGNSEAMNRRCRHAIYCLLLPVALYLSGCSSQAPQKTEAFPAEYAAQANDVLFNALGLVGTPYRYGGSTPDSGFDCSGLIDYVYRESADLTLPRTVAELNTLDAPNIAADKLQSGRSGHFRHCWRQSPESRWHLCR